MEGKSMAGLIDNLSNLLMNSKQAFLTAHVKGLKGVTSEQLETMVQFYMETMNTTVAMVKENQRLCDVVNGL